MTIPKLWNESINEEVQKHRQPEYSIHPQFINRWSPRSFSDREVTGEILYTILEAARWAPSANNLQPWRFLIANTQEKLDVFKEFINPNNRIWIDRAPVLVLIASKRLNNKGETNNSAPFDAGAAWGSIALQATWLGIQTHAIGGFDKNKARELLGLSEDEYNIHAIVAIGYRGPLEQLTESLQEREKPNGRQPIADHIVDWNL